MAKIADAYVGARFGRLTVVSERTPGKRPRVLTKCDCGAEKSIAIDCLGGRTNSCGCLHRQQLVEKMTTHGQSGSPEHHIWLAIIQRCTNSSNAAYDNYGGRGVTICDEWRYDYVAFITSVGPRPGPEYSIDRIDNDGNYEPGNVRWATRSEQNQNQRPRVNCRHGHRIEGDNERIHRGVRECRECFRARARENMRRRRAKARDEEAAIEVGLDTA